MQSSFGTPDRDALSLVARAQQLDSLAMEPGVDSPDSDGRVALRPSGGGNFEDYFAAVWEEVELSADDDSFASMRLGWRGDSPSSACCAVDDGLAVERCLSDATTTTAYSSEASDSYDDDLDFLCSSLMKGGSVRDEITYRVIGSDEATEVALGWR